MRVELSIETSSGFSVRVIGSGYIEFSDGRPFLTLPCHTEKDFNDEIDILIDELTVLKAKAKERFAEIKRPPNQ
jgi:hypothetical protein